MLETIILATSALATAAIGTKVVMWDNALKKLRKDMEIGFSRLELFHINDSFIQKIKEIKKTWIDIYGSQKSIEFANMMEQNVLAVYNDAKTQKFTIEDYNRVVSLVDAAIEYSRRDSASVLNVSNETNEQIEQIIKDELQKSKEELYMLAIDNVFNNTQARLKDVFISYAKRYSNRMVIFLAKNNI
jgi:cupin superfamily acireductone dioxygenase involved in methionine salvage